MRALLAFVAAGVQLAAAEKEQPKEAPTPKLMLRDAIREVDMDCFQTQCAEMGKACAVVDADCAKRMQCMASRSADAPPAQGVGYKRRRSCFRDLTLDDLSQSEKDLLNCAHQNQCLALITESAAFFQVGQERARYLAPASLAELGAELGEPDGGGDQDKPDYDGLAKAEAKIKKFTQRTQRHITDLEQEQRARKKKDGDDDEDKDDEDTDAKGEDGEVEAAAWTKPSSLLQVSDGPDGPPASSPVDSLLAGIEAMVGKAEQHAGKSLLEVSKHMPPIEKLPHIDDTTLMVALGAMTSVMGKSEEASASFLQTESDSAVSKAYQLGIALGQSPEFLSRFLSPPDHPGYLPKDVAAQLEEPEPELRTA